MPYIINRLSDAPIIFITQSGSGVIHELNEYLPQVAALLDEQTEPVYLVFDVRAISITLDELTLAAHLAAGDQGAVLHHPNVIETLLATTAGAVKLAAQGVRTAAFGGAKIRTFDTPEQALAYCHEQIALAAGR